MNITTTAVIIDVREPKEFHDGTIETAINLPFSQFNIDQYEAYREHTICLLCQSGNRAKQVKEHLIKNGFKYVLLMNRQMESVQHKQINKGWSVDRQFRLTLGFLFGISFAGYFFGTPETLYFGVAIVCALTITAIIDRCYLRMGIALLPWNREKR